MAEYLNLNYISIAGASIATLVGYYLVKDAKKSEESQKKYVEAPEFDPEQLTQGFKIKKNKQLINNFTLNVEKTSEVRGKVYIKGVATTKDPLKSTVNNNHKLVYSVTQQKNIPLNIQMVNEFSLNSVQTKQTCNVKSNIDVQVHKNVLKEIPVNNISPNQQSNNILQTQYGIPVGSLLVLYGEVFFDRKTQEIRIEVPEYIAASKKQILQMINHGKLGNKILGYTLLIGGTCVLLGFIGIKIRKWLKQNKQKQIN